MLFLCREGLWCPGAVPQEPLPLARPEWLFCAVCVGHRCHHAWYTLGYCIFLVLCLPWSCSWLYRPQYQWEGISVGIWRGCFCLRYQSLSKSIHARFQHWYQSFRGDWADLVRCWSAPATLQQQVPCRTHWILNKKMTVVASLSHVRVMVDQTLPTQLISKVKDFTLILMISLYSL